MKKIIKLLLCALAIISITGCAKKEEIELTSSNYKDYFTYNVTGTSNLSFVQDSNKVYIDEAVDDYDYYYQYGYVYDSMKIPFIILSKTDKYTCEDCKITVKASGTIENIYSGLTSYKSQTRNVNKQITINLSSDLTDKAIIGTGDIIINSFGSPLNDVNGIWAWDIDWDLVSVEGKLVEK